MTKSIIIYSKGYCPYCKNAKALLIAKGVTFTEFEITGNSALTAEMVERSGRHTVPQIFIGDLHVGGGSDLAELDARGGLDHLLEPFLKKFQTA
jgi:glutaredoxin 3